MKQRDLIRNTSRLKEERYAYAVNVASKLFLEKGIDEVKMTDIAENCGIGVASLYRYFETKTEIVIRAGCILWEKINADFLTYVDRDESATGLDSLHYALSYYKELFLKHRDFIKFLDDFDQLMLSEKVPWEQLKRYENSVGNFYDPIRMAYERGVADGTVRKVDDLLIVYTAITHSLISVSQKFIRGAILSRDEFPYAVKEIEKILEMTAAFLAA